MKRRCPYLHISLTLALLFLGWSPVLDAASADAEVRMVVLPSASTSVQQEAPEAPISLNVTGSADQSIEIVLSEYVAITFDKPKLVQEEDSIEGWSNSATVAIQSGGGATSSVSQSLVSNAQGQIKWELPKSSQMLLNENDLVITIVY